ncbi:single strand binding protein [Salmonella phage 21]|nr:single strand binding protein [Salmonella phage 21]
MTRVYIDPPCAESMKILSMRSSVWMLSMIKSLMDDMKAFN